MLSELRVLEKLTEGAAADLYLAQRHATKEQVILEVLRTEHMTDHDVRQRFVAEVQLRRDWNHPNLARRIQAGEAHNGRPFVVSEPLRGQSLRRIISPAQALAPQDFMRLMLPLCDALSYLHDHNTAHGNLCPEAVYLPGGLKAFNPKLLDSGLSLLRVFSPSVSDRVVVRPEYLSPERIQGHRFNALSDVYAMGVLMFEMLTGSPPFTDADLRTTRRRHLEDAPPPLPKELEAFTPVLERCIAKDPNQRFESILALKDALSKLWKAAYASRTPLPPKKKLLGAEGKVMGAYQLERCIGEGAMGAVYEGRHLRLERKVALKVLKSELSTNATFVDRFFQEAKAANKVRHEHIVEIQDYIDAPNEEGGPRYACVMELLEGQSLGQALRSGPVSLERTVHIAMQACAALGAAHQAGVIHRDIKPDNIFLTQRNGDPDFVKILDFGIAKLSVENDGEGLTRNGEILGTPEYMAPEQLAGRPADARTDVYSMASVIYRVLADRPPFKGRSLGELLSMLVNAPPRPLDATNKAGQPIPPGLRALVMRCLDKNPDNRPQSMLELRNLLAPFAQLVDRGLRVVSSAVPVSQAAPQGFHGMSAPASINTGGSGSTEPGVSSQESHISLNVPKQRTGGTSGNLRKAQVAASHTVSLPSSGDEVLELNRPAARSNPSLSSLMKDPGSLSPLTENRLELDYRSGRTSRISQASMRRVAAEPIEAVPSRKQSSKRSSSTLWWVVTALLIAGAMSFAIIRQSRSSMANPEAEAPLRDLAVTSSPSGADVYRADTNEFLGITPFRATFRPEDNGAIMLRFERTNTPPLVKTIRLGSDRNVHAEFGPGR